jgi:hypothetical protein
MICDSLLVKIRSWRSGLECACHAETFCASYLSVNSRRKSTAGSCILFYGAFVSVFCIGLSVSQILEEVSITWVLLLVKF